jgi:hypothetical protein
MAERMGNPPTMVRNPAIKQHATKPVINVGFMMR